MLKADIDWFEGRLNRIYELEAARHYGMEAGCDAWVELKKLYTEMSAETPKLIAAAREALRLRESFLNVTKESMAAQQRIQDLQAERDRHRKALEYIANATDCEGSTHAIDQKVARDALTPEASHD